MEQNIQVLLQDIQKNLQNAASAEQIKDLKDQQEKLSTDLMELQQKVSFSAAPKTTVIRTLGDRFINSNEYKSFSLGQTRSIRIELNDQAILADTAPVSIGTPAGVVQPDRRPGIIAQPSLNRVVEALLNSATTTSNMVEYVKEKTWANNAAEVEEGKAKPASSIEFETASAPVRTVAHIMRITKQLAEDAPSLASYINTRMLEGVNDRVERQIISGDGNGQNLKGLFADGNYTPHGYTVADNLSKIDLISKCIAVLQKEGYSPSAILMNPLDWNAISLEKDSNGKYLLADPAAAVQNRLWGLPVVVSAAVASGKFMVGEFAAAGSVFTRSSTVIEMFEQDSNNVEHNLITIRAECRKALAVERPGALIGGDFPVAG